MAAHALGRHFILVDNNAEAIKVIVQRLAGVPAEYTGFDPALSDLPATGSP